MNRIQSKLQENKKLLSLYFTAGYPAIDDTVSILTQLQDSGVDMVEIGLPFSDPLADGPTIQESSTVALKNGMTTEKLFSQLDGIRETIHIPLIVMGYFNPMLQYGVEKFCARCQEIGIDGIIMPDLPLAEYEAEYKATFEKYGLINVGNTQSEYFERIASMNLKNPQIVGFGISNSDTFQAATAFAKGAIIGSAFIKHITTHGAHSVKEFVEGIR